VTPDTIGRYQVLERIGGGAMGTVYRANDPQIGRTIAIKVLNVNDQELHARFRQEVRTAGTLTHPNIVAIHDYGEANGLPFIVMEYVEGQTLAEVMRDRVALTLPSEMRLMQQLCAALEYAHARGVGVDGKITAARVLKSIPPLDDAALEAVKQWEFTPTFVKGTAVPVIMTVTVSFTLS
jgi:TonB family protein